MGYHHPFKTFLRSFDLLNLQITFHNLDQSNFQLSLVSNKTYLVRREEVKRKVKILPDSGNFCRSQGICILWCRIHHVFCKDSLSLYFYPFWNTCRYTCNFLCQYLPETFLFQSDEISLSKATKSITRNTAVPRHDFYSRTQICCRSLFATNWLKNNSLVTVLTHAQNRESLPLNNIVELKTIRRVWWCHVLVLKYTNFWSPPSPTIFSEPPSTSSSPLVILHVELSLNLLRRLYAGI